MTPLLAILGITDFLIIFFIFICVIFFSYIFGVFGAKADVNQRADQRRLERKLDALLKQQGISLQPVVSEDVQRILRDLTKKPEAIKLHGEQAGLGEEDATADVEAFLADKD